MVNNACTQVQVRGWNGSAAKRLAGVAPEVNLRNPLHTGQETRKPGNSPRSPKRGIQWPYKKDLLYSQFFFKKGGYRTCLVSTDSPSVRTVGSSPRNPGSDCPALHTEISAVAPSTETNANHFILTSYQKVVCSVILWFDRKHENFSLKPCPAGIPASWYLLHIFRP